MKAFLQFGVFLGVAVVFQPGLMTPAQGDDWPQWLGPHRDGLWRETGIVDGIPAGGLVLRWSTPIQGGYAGPSVADGRVYVTDFVPTPHARARAYGEAHENENYRRVSRVGHERLLCLREKDGHILWTHDHPTTYTHARLYANGPRTTPLVDGTCVYTLGAEGRLCCIDTETQAELWSHDLKADYHINAPTWGFATHPIIDGCQLITMVGGEGSAVVAFDKHTGQELWRSLSCRNPGYAQLTIETLGVHRQLLAWHGEALNSLNPDTGRANWTFPVKPAHQMTIGMPRREGNKLYIMSWDCSRAFELNPERPEARLLWRADNRLGVGGQMNVPWIEGGYIYAGGLRGTYRCVELATGQRIWETDAIVGRAQVWIGNIFSVKQGSRFFLTSELGDLMIANLSPRG